MFPGILILLLTVVPAPQDAGIETLLVGDRAGYQRIVEMGESAIEDLSRILEDDKFDGIARFMAANALGDIGSKKAVEPLLAALKDPYYNIRRCAALALGKLRDERAREPLEKLAKDDPFVWKDPKTGAENYLVREDALRALDLLSGKIVSDVAGLVKEKETFLEDASKLPPSRVKLKIRRLPFPFPGGFKDQGVFNNYEQPTDDYVHAGLDILHPPGAEVRAVDGGFVAVIFTNYPEWKTHHFFVVTTEKDGAEGWCYTHLDPETFTFKVGDKIAQGQVLGKVVDFYVGKNKGADHLHLNYVRYTRDADGKVDFTSLVDPLLYFDWQDEVPPVIHAPFHVVRAGTLDAFPAGEDGLPVVRGDVDVIAGISDTAFADQACNWMVPIVTIEIRGKDSAPWRKLVLDQRGEIAEPTAAPALYIRQDAAARWTKDEPPYPPVHFMIATHTDGDGVLERNDALQSWSTAEATADGKRRFPDGVYEITIRAWDLKEHRAEHTEKVRVANR